MNSDKFINHLRARRIPVRAMIQLTYKCNFRCVHCYETPLKGVKEESPSLDEWAQILKVLREHGCMFLTFTGGEIFTIPFFMELYEYAYDLGFKISLVSNGSLITSQVITLFESKKPEKVYISLYGMSDNTYTTFCQAKGSYDKVISNITQLRSSNINTVIMYLTNILNWKELNSAYDFAHDQHCQFYQFYRFRACVDGDCSPQAYQLDAKTLVAIQPKDELEILYNKTISDKHQWLEGYKWCNAGLTSIMVDPQGRAFLCDSVAAKRFPILQHDFDEIWKNLYAQRKQYIEVPSACSECGNRELCGVCAPTLVTEHGGCSIIPTRECTYAADLRVALEEKYNVQDM